MAKLIQNENFGEKTINNKMALKFQRKEINTKGKTREINSGDKKKGQKRKKNPKN